MSFSSEFHGFDVVRRGYARDQVDQYLASLSGGGSPVGPPSFDLVRRGYDCRQVDERIRELQAGSGLGW